MNENHKRMPGWGWAIAGLALLALYVLSIGPVEWLSHHDMIPDFAAPVLQVLYAPISFAFLQFPEPVREAVQWYVDLWVP